MPVVNQFAYGPIDPIVAYFCSFMGVLLGLMCTARARQCTSLGRRARWLVLAAVAIGGPGIWLMHFMAMLGFDVPATVVRYNVALTVVSLVTAIVVVAAGLFLAGLTTPTPLKIIGGGLFTGGGVAAMHYVGMAAMHLGGTVSYAQNLVIASVLIAVAACTVALWFAVSVSGTLPIIGAAAVMAVAISGMHYTGMAAMQVHLDQVAEPISGVNPLLFLVPITVLTIATLFGLVLSSMTMMATEDSHVTVIRPLGDLSVVPTAPIPISTQVVTPAADGSAARFQPAEPRRIRSNLDAGLRRHRR